jgi:lysophospholipase L1-like esterase
MKKLTVFTIVVVGMLLITAEAISRVILLRVYNRGFDSSLIIDNKYFNSAGLKSNAAGTVWGKSFSTDELGGRRNPKAASAKNKWLYIGDSVTEGVGVDDSCTFSSLSSERKKDFQLYNISLIGYSLSDYANVLKYYLPADTTIKRVTLFYCLNDVYGTAKSKDLPEMVRNSFIGKANAFLQQNYATYKLLKLLVFSQSNNYFIYDLQFYENTNPRFTEAMNQLYQCDSLCKLNGTEMYVVLLPYRSQVNGKNDPLLPQQLVQDFCNSEGISCHDASTYLKESKDSENLYLFADEIHLSETGHRVVAHFLQKEGL